MQYSYIDIVKELNGTLKHLVLGGSNGSHSTFLHDCECYRRHGAANERILRNTQLQALEFRFRI